MRTGAIPNPRCRHAIQYGDNMMTRCIFKPAHAGQHEGKSLKKFPYKRIYWFSRVREEFLTDRDSEWAWSDKKEKK